MIMIDARGMRCPWPALRLARALRNSPGESFALLADDPAAERECRATAVAVDYTLVIAEPDVFHVVPARGVNTLFTDGG